MNLCLEKTKLLMTIVLFLLGLLQMPDFARADSSVCSSSGYSIVTINGIFTNEKEASKNLLALKNELKSYLHNNQPISYEYLHNPSHLAGAGDVLKGIQQGLFDQKSDYDLTEMLDDASRKVTTQKLLLVAH